MHDIDLKDKSLYEIPLNQYQSTFEELNLLSYPDEVQEQFFDYITNVPMIKYMIGNDRKRACDLERDEEGKIIVDITHPHILEDMEYFIPAAKHYQKYGCYTNLRPNPNPNSEYGKWIREELRRCYKGYVRESDGEWIPGTMYFFLNYCPIQQTKYKKGSKKGDRVIDFPKFWEGIYYRYHYLDQAEKGGFNGCEISRRGSGKSLTIAAIFARNFVLGLMDSDGKIIDHVKSMAVAYSKEYLVTDGILTKFQAYIDFLAQNTQFPSKRITQSMQNMMWKAGYLDLDTQTQKGTLNELFGVSVKDDPAKVRGKRIHFVCFEEFGSFKNVLELYNILMPSIREGDIAYGTAYLIGTAGDKDSDFQGAQELVYNPRGYFMLPLENRWDFEGRGKNEITFFFSSYMSRLNCYDENGNSDVTKALLEVLAGRYKVKYNSTDINSITKTIAEMPITPQEAILRTRSNYFPVTALNERIVQLDNNPNEFDDVYTGELFMNSKKEVEFLVNHDMPIRDYPLKDNTNNKGCVEIFEMPEKDKNDKVYSERYIIGYDPANNDDANSVSLISILVLDLWTDRIVAEYTGRPTYVDDGHEIARLMALYYNAKIYYENNIKGCFGYFQKLQCLHLLADVPQYLKDKQLIKYSTFGNASKGIAATNPINNFANDRIREWLIKEVPTIKHEDGNDIETKVPNLSFIRNRALLKELALYNPDINVDRVRALGMAMLGREEKVILYQGDIQGKRTKRENRQVTDDFFTRNYDDRIANASWDLITQ